MTPSLIAALVLMAVCVGGTLWEVGWNPSALPARLWTWLPLVGAVTMLALWVQQQVPRLGARWQRVAVTALTFGGTMLILGAVQELALEGTWGGWSRVLGSTVGGLLFGSLTQGLPEGSRLKDWT